MQRRFMLLGLLATAGCGRKSIVPAREAEPALYPNETPQLRALINEYAAIHDIPASLIHRVIQR